MKTEQRKYGRFLARDDAFAALGSEFACIGKIKDIGMGGLAFEYIDSFSDSNPAPAQRSISEPSRVDIFLSENGFHLSDVPCRIMYDVIAPVSAQRQGLSTSFGLRRCGVRFGMLTENHTVQLEYFIKTHAAEVLP